MYPIRWKRVRNILPVFLAVLCVVSLGRNVNGSKSDISMKKSTYVLNTHTGIIHCADCGAAEQIRSENRKITDEPLETLILSGYTPCKKCCPEIS